MRLRHIRREVGIQQVVSYPALGAGLSIVSRFLGIWLNSAPLFY